MTAYKEFEKELQSLVKIATEALRAILLSKDRTSKHAPYSWQEEDINEHVFKAIGHIAYGAGQFHEYKKPDGEDHIHNAIVRLLMAKWLIDHPAEKTHKPCYSYGADIIKTCLEQDKNIQDTCSFFQRGTKWKDCFYGKLYQHKNKTRG